MLGANPNRDSVEFKRVSLRRYWHVIAVSWIVAE
jgi:hypothetical protein